jgi:hypothetical protein
VRGGCEWPGAGEALALRRVCLGGGPMGEVHWTVRRLLAERPPSPVAGGAGP